MKTLCVSEENAGLMLDRMKKVIEELGLPINQEKEVQDARYRKVRIPLLKMKEIINEYIAFTSKKVVMRKALQSFLSKLNVA